MLWYYASTESFIILPMGISEVHLISQHKKEQFLHRRNCSWITIPVLKTQGQLHLDEFVQLRTLGQLHLGAFVQFRTLGQLHLDTCLQ